MKLSDAQQRALDALSVEQSVGLADLALALDTVPEGAARTASSLVQRGLATRVENDGRVGYLLSGTDPSQVDSRSVADGNGDHLGAPTVPQLTDEHQASLALLRHLGGKAYCGPEDDERRTTIARTSADALEAAGLVELHHRSSYVVAIVIEEAA